MPLPGHAKISKQVIDPAEARRIEPALARTANPDVWVYRYDDPDSGWRLSIATHAEPGSGKLSLGGFRIAPEARTSLPDFDTDREAIELAIGMEEKVYWSRLLSVGGPHALRAQGRIVGGKCVLRPTPDARVGQPRDRELLDFAIACFEDFEATSGVLLTTGQDLGHGVMSDGETGSLEYLNRHFRGSVVADTSKPTGEGNYHLLAGMLRAAGVELAGARVGLIGAGNIGRHILGRLRERGATPLVLEMNPRTREALELEGVRTWPAEAKDEFLRQPMEAVVVNAAGGSLDIPAVERIAANEAVRVVNGSENLTMPDPGAAEVLRAARRIYAPTELGGMMGYLTAVEEFLSRRAGEPFDPTTLYEAARRLDHVGYEGVREVLRRDHAISFEDAVRAVFGGPTGR